MSINPRLNRCLELLDKVDPKTHSLTISSKNEVCKESKSFLINFIRWFIHLITFKHFPVNAKLDLATRSVLNVASEITRVESTDPEKKRVIKSLGTLKIICEENGGSEVANIKKLIETIRKK